MTYILKKHLFALTLFTLILTLLPISSQARSAAAPTNDTFTPAKCMFTVPGSATEGADIICGYLTVPEDYAQPDGATIRLAVAIIKSKRENKKVDPIFFAQGGPGGSTLDSYVDPLLSPDSRLRKDRDLVLFDQRGTLYSQPSLYCKEYDQLILDTLEKDLTTEEYERMDLETMSACRDRLLQEGVNLSSYDSIENARDIESLRLALGYEKINLYGVSYGTLLAQHYLRLYPGSLRSVTLDGVVAPQINSVLDNAINEDRAFKKLFSSCAEDPDCNRTYPNLEQEYEQLLDKLEKAPARVPMTDPDSNISYNTVIDGESFQGSIFQMLYVSDLIPALPLIIHNAVQGDYTAFGRILSIFIFDRSMSMGMFYSVWCAEDADFEPEDFRLENVNPRIAEWEKRSPYEFLTLCKAWNVEPLGTEADQPVSSSVPTLLLSGEFDPVTPPKNAEAAATTLSHSYNFVFPTGAHGQLLDSECSDGIFLSFLEDPNTRPDGSCIQDTPNVEFYTKNNLVPLPVFLRMLTLEGNIGYEALTFLGGLLLLSTALFFIPFAWFLKILQPKPRVTPEQTFYQQSGEIPQSPVIPSYPSAIEMSDVGMSDNTPQRPPLFVSLASWGAVAEALLLLTFPSILAIFIFQMVSANDNRLLFGIVHEARIWFILPFIGAILAFEMLAATLQGWLWKGWSIGWRLYYTLITLAAILCILILAKWGMLTVLF